MGATGTFLSVALATSVVEVRDLPHEVGLSMRIIFMYFTLYLYKRDPGARDGGEGDVFVAGIGVVGHIGPGPSPRSPAWHAC